MSNLSSLSIFAKKKKIIAFDVGRVFLGVALSDSTRTLAFPYTVLKWDSRPGVFEEFFRKLMKDEMLESIVIGKPMAFAGFDNANVQSNRAVEQFVKIIEKISPEMPIYMVDERVSTIEAGNRLADAGIEKGRRDAVAAQIILERFLAKEKE